MAAEVLGPVSVKELRVKNRFHRRNFEALFQQFFASSSPRGSQSLEQAQGYWSKQPKEAVIIVSHSGTISNMLFRCVQEACVFSGAVSLCRAPPCTCIVPRGDRLADHRTAPSRHVLFRHRRPTARHGDTFLPLTLSQRSCGKTQLHPGIHCTECTSTLPRVPPPTTALFARPPSTFQHYGTVLDDSYLLPYPNPSTATWTRQSRKCSSRATHPS